MAMVRFLECVAEHDFWLVGLSAIICLLGCFTTVVLIARARHQRRGCRRTLALAAFVFGCSVWSLHFVAMLAFVPAQQVNYAPGPAVGSALLAIFGAFAGLLTWQVAAGSRWRVVVGGVLFGLAVTGMHYLGVAAMSASSLLWFDAPTVAVSVVLTILVFTVGLFRAAQLDNFASRLECTLWMTLAICSLHFIGMSAVSVTPLALDDTGGLIGSSAIAVAVAGVVIVGLVACLVEGHLSQRTVQELARMRVMGDLAQEVLLILRDDLVVEVNTAGERLFKKPSSDIIGRPLNDLFSQASQPALLRRQQCAPHERQPEEMECRAADGTGIPVEISCQPASYMGKMATVVVLRDLTDRKRDEARIHYLARHDALTDLPNRYALLEYLAEALATAERDGTAVALGFIDLDRFKPVNDLYGHAVGDAVLIESAMRIRAELDPSDILARIGGDEFIMLLTGDPQPAAVSEVANRVVDALRRPFVIDGRRIEIGGSVGTARFPDDCSEADMLMRAADTAMYRAKTSGRSAVCAFELAMNTRLQTRLQLEHELVGAVGRGELSLVFQPITNATTGTLENFEALIRWNNPRCGAVSPGEFIPIAEETGLIDAIGRWVIDAACREAATWPAPWLVSVNVSPRQFHTSDICEAVGSALRRHGLTPSRLVIEVTEGTLINDADKAVAILDQLRSLGVRIALDDFGTGYSSLSYLQRFRFDKFKIDQSFVQRLGQHEHALTLTRAIVNLGHNLGLSVTAEGVETVAQLETLQKLGCDHIQGYLIGRPAPVASFGPSEQARAVRLIKDAANPGVARPVAPPDFSLAERQEATLMSVL